MNRIITTMIILVNISAPMSILALSAIAGALLASCVGYAHAAFVNSHGHSTATHYHYRATTHHQHQHQIILHHHDVNNNHFHPSSNRRPRNNNNWLRSSSTSSKLYKPLLQVQSMTSTSLQVNLRDIMDDGPLPPKMDDSLDDIQTQKLTKQLTKLSTQEIKRELELVHGISTVALRGKTMMVKTLVDARLNLNGNDKQKENPDAVVDAVDNMNMPWGASASTFDNMDIDDVINMNMNNHYGPDIKTMSPSEIKRELKLYGVSTDNDSLFMEKRDLEAALLRERQSQRSTIPSSSQFQQMMGPGEFSVSSVGGGGREKTTTTSQVATQLNAHSPSESEYMYNYDINNDDDDDENNHQSPTTTDQEKDKEQDKLRSLQIAYEFERVQSTLPDPSDIRYELESKFSISTKYFLGITEMAYALAVARVDDRFERQRSGLVDSDGCVVGEDGLPIPRNKNDDDSSDGGCLMEDELPTPEELIAMEYDNLQPWTELALSEELENQYGIPAKHFMGKKEMAYALAVERVDRAMKEGGFIVDDIYEEEEGDYAVMTDEDMMKMMEEEMRKENEEEERMEEQEMRQREEWNTSRKPQQQQQQQQQQPRSSSVRDSPSSKRFSKQEPNPFQKQAQPAYQSTPLADMIKTDKKRDRVRPEQRTPLSSEPPLGSQRLPRQNDNNINYNININSNDDFIEMGTVIGDRSGSGAKDSKSLTDILKGSEQQNRSPSRPRSRNATMPPPRPNMKQPTPRSARVKFTKSAARVDDAFSGYSSAWESNKVGVGPSASNTNNYGPNFASVDSNRGYSSSWSKGSPHSVTSARSGKRGNAGVNAQSQRPFEPAGKRGNVGVNAQSQRPFDSAGKRGNAGANTQSSRPFEPAPFTEPGTHNMNSAQSASSQGPGPQRVPPQTPFTSPVTDGPTPRRNSQGPFTPFTPPGKRSANGRPPPRKRPASDPRGFNIKDTPDNSQPFTGSQAYFDQNTVYSPPLQVEPPPRDPNYVPPERPFEPAPFSNPQPHSVRTGATNYNNVRDKWNRVDVGNNAVPPPYNNDGAANRSYQQQQYKQQQRTQQQKSTQKKKVHKTGSTSPFDNLKDMFSNMGNKKEKEDKKEVEEPVGFKSGNVEVLSSDDDDTSPKSSWRQGAREVEIIDAELWTGDEEEEPRPSAQNFSNAWKGGPKPDTSPFTISNGVNDETAIPDNANNGMSSDHDSSTMMNDQATQRAQHLLSTSPKVRALVIKAQSNPKVQQAVQECMGNPTMFGRYLDDEEVGPILKELKECIL